MIDQNSQFFAILTAVGEAKQANATALGQPWTFAQMGVGDANLTDPIPNRTQTRLINEWRRAPVNQVRTDPANPNIIITEQVIPADVGGKWIREIALYDADGDMVAVANCAPSFKPLLVQGTGKTQIIRMNFIVANTASVVLKIDPAIVLATREYVDTQIIEAMAKMDFKHSVLVATTANIALSGVQTIDGVLLPADARVLVKNQTTAKENGLYVVSSTGVWKRTQDADSSVEVTPGLFVSVETGTVNGDSVWQLVTDAPIVLGTTALAFEMVAGRTGVTAGAYFKVTVDKLGRVIAGLNPNTLAAFGILDGIKIGQLGLAATTAPALDTFRGFPATGFYSGFGEANANATPGAPPGTGNVQLGILAVTPSPTLTFYVAMSAATAVANRGYWFGQYLAGTLTWTRLLSLEDLKTITDSIATKVTKGVAGTADIGEVAADIDAIRINGSYMVLQSATGDKPTASSIGSVLHVERGSSNSRWQFYNPAGEQRLLFRATSTTGAWGAQTEVMLSTHKANQPEVDAGADDAKFVTSKTLASRLSSLMPPGFKTGLKMSNAAAGSALLSVSPGRAKSADGLYDLVVPAALTGGIPAAGGWVAGGVNQGKLDTGVRANNAWYHVFLIRKVLDGSVDLLFSLSPTAPTMPGGYVGFRRIGSVKTGADGAFVPFYQVQNRFYWSVPIADVSVTLAGSATASYVVSAPTGVQAIAMLNYLTEGSNALVLITSPLGETQVPTATNRIGYGAYSNSVPEGGAGYLEVATNSASQVVCTANVSYSIIFNINTLGWIEEF